MPQPNIWEFVAIGTNWSIETQLPLGAELQQRIAAQIEAFDATYSRFREDSLVTKISRSAGTYQFPGSATSLFGLYQQLYEATNGKMTPLVGVLLDQLGYDAQYSLVQKDLPVTVPTLSVLQWHGTTLTVDQPVLIDIGAIGKGYLVDCIADLLDEAHTVYTIDASGDIRTRGLVEQIGLEDPFDGSKVIGVIKLHDESLCGSATNRRKWGDALHHIVDPDTGRSTSGIAATWVKAKTTALADGLATALFFADPDTLRQVASFEYVCFYDNRSIRYSEGMKEGVA